MVAFVEHPVGGYVAVFIEYIAGVGGDFAHVGAGVVEHEFVIPPLSAEVGNRFGGNNDAVAEVFVEILSGSGIGHHLV